MTEDYVKPETLQLAFDKNIDWISCIDGVRPDKEILLTQSLFQKFLREKHGVQISINNSFDEIPKYSVNVFIYKEELKNIGRSGYFNPKYLFPYSKYEDALENAFIKAIKLL